MFLHRFPSGFVLCYGTTSVTVCLDFYTGKYGVDTGRTVKASYTDFEAGKYGVVTGQTTETSCTASGADKYRVETGGSGEASCTTCGTGGYRTNLRIIMYDLWHGHVITCRSVSVRGT